MKTFIMIPLLSFVIVGFFGIAGCSSAPATSQNIPKFEVDTERFPYTPHYIELENGASVHYLDEGEGPILLLLHGNPTWSFLYRHLVEELKNDFRVIAPDYPGFGLSMAPSGYGYTAAEHAAAMMEFVERLDLRGMTLMVQDWGGPIGFAVAERYPERVDAFVIGNTWAWPLERTGHKVFSTLMGGWPGQFAAWCCNGIVHFFMSQGVEQEVDDAEFAMYTAPFADSASRSPTHIFPAQLWDADAFLQSVHDGLSELSDRPALIVWGIEDFAFQEPERTRFEALFPDHRTVLLENAGHFIQEDAPQEIASAIRSWYRNRVYP
ncbi:MAG: alpha/beta fold hydrolase [Pseudomonadales bacterium]|jgi:haloalkane dehalogenase|nr:alpha/beta fold hydrolase [Pseudomonadales bacterium]MBL6817052.1 alpha/beta fold hydrolase [Pseudomonadales bacterium]